MSEKRFTLYKGLDTINIMDNTKFREQIYINKSSKDMKCLVGLLNELAEENKKLKRENEYLNSELIRLDKELFCQDCLTCRHSESINIEVECAEGEKEYHSYCDFYEISEEWVDD